MKVLTSAEFQHILGASCVAHRGAFLLAAPRGFGLRQAFMRVCDKVGLSGRRFHDLRHLFVTSLFKAGAPAPAVQAVVLRRRPR